MAVLQPLGDLELKEISFPDKIDTENLTKDEIDSDFVISRDADGNTLSRYTDDIWDLSTYKSNNNSSPIVNFHENFSLEQKEECKKIFFLLYCYGSGRNNSIFSISSLKRYISILAVIAVYSDNKNIKVTDMLTTEYHLLNFIKNHMISSQAASFLSLLNFFKNKSTFLKYRESKATIELLSKINSSNKNTSEQTLTIPSRILSESIKERWKQIDTIEAHLHNIKTYLYNYLDSPSFGYTDRNTKNIDKEKAIEWEKTIEKHNLNDLFIKYHITGRKTFHKFITQIQGTCYHLVLAYSGMRRNEALSLKNNCLEIADKNTMWLIGNTTKTVGQKKQVKWVTTKEIKRVIHILNSINSIIGDIHNIELSDLPLFVATKYMLLKNFKNHSVHKRAFAQTDVLPIDENKMLITKQDLKEIRDIDFKVNEDRVKIGDVWNFTPHQYRRSLAIYAIQSGKVSLGALQIQFKHLFREMTLYYSNGSSFAKKLFDDGIKQHISKDMQKIEPELETLDYIKEVLFSDEKLYGLHGKVVENGFKKENNEDYRTYFLKNREETIKRFKNGEIAYKSTALGGCVATEACDSRLTRSITACLDCHGGILKKSKVDKVIQKQKEFIEFLSENSMNSIEYRTEIDDLKELEDMSKKLIGE